MMAAEIRDSVKARIGTIRERENRNMYDETLSRDVAILQMELIAEVAAQLAEFNVNLEWWGNRMLEHWSRSGG
jgi:hypothetical protein